MLKQFETIHAMIINISRFPRSMDHIILQDSHFPSVFPPNVKATKCRNCHDAEDNGDYRRYVPCDWLWALQNETASDNDIRQKSFRSRSHNSAAWPMEHHPCSPVGHFLISTRSSSLGQSKSWPDEIVKGVGASQLLCVSIIRIGLKICEKQLSTRLGLRRTCHFYNKT
jgi:hypothetical protein